MTTTLLRSPDEPPGLRKMLDETQAVLDSADRAIEAPGRLTQRYQRISRDLASQETETPLPA